MRDEGRVWDVVIAGSGAAGVSAAVPLVEAGLEVLMVDPGDDPDPELPEPGADSTLAQARRADPDQWRWLLGPHLQELDAADRSTPKFRVPALRHVWSGFEQAYGLRAEGIKPVGSVATGGLTGMWGAGTAFYTGADLAGFPLEPADLMPHYRRIAARIGISGEPEDDLFASPDEHLPLQPPLPLGRNAERIWSAYQVKRRQVGERGFALGRARNAVLSQPFRGRGACDQRNLCLWGCPRSAIYSARHDLSTLAAYGNFQHRRGLFVSSIRAADGIHMVACRDRETNTVHMIRTRAVALATGAIATTMLVAQLQGALGRDLPIQAHPAFAFALCLPARVGARLGSQGFALAELSYQLAEPGADSPAAAFGYLFSAEGLQASELMEHLPVSRPAARVLTRALTPALMLGNCYLPSSFAECRLRVEGTASAATAHLVGRHTAEFSAAARRITGRLAQAFRSLGAPVLPRSMRVATLGSDGHFVGGVPMTESPGPMQSSPDGEIPGFPGVYVVDGAALPRLPAKHPTLVIMANADRIGQLMAARLGGRELTLDRARSS